MWGCCLPLDIDLGCGFFLSEEVHLVDPPAGEELRNISSSSAADAVIHINKRLGKAEGRRKMRMNIRECPSATTVHGWGSEEEEDGEEEMKRGERDVRRREV